MAWSKYQNQIFEFATNPMNGSFVVKAVAGSGKTTTSVECAKRIVSSNPDLRVLFLAFNKSIVDKLKEKLVDYPNIRCSTLHALGLSVLGKLKISVNDNKYKNWFTDKYIRYLDAPLEESKKWAYIYNCVELLRLCRINLVTARQPEAIVEIMNRHSIFPVANEASAVARVLQISSNLMMFRSKNGYEVDYTDMITLPLSEGFRKMIPKYDVVFIDEAQDLSKAQQELMLECVRPNVGKFIAVGDPSQSIVGFAGAMCDSFDILAEKAGKILPLSVNYRCGRNIVSAAQKYVKEIEAYEDATDGEIVRQKSLSDVKPGDMIICRKTKPLVSVAIKLMAQGKSCFVKGRDIAESIIQLIEQAENTGTLNQITMTSLYAHLDKDIETLYEKLFNQGVANPQTHPAMIDLRDKIGACKIIGSQTENPAEMKALLNKIFDDQIHGDAIMLSTVHKAKGLEAENVYIICPELLPFRHKNQQLWEIQQENNLAYVAITRAKNRLVYVDVSEDDIESVKI